MFVYYVIPKGREEEILEAIEKNTSAIWGVKKRLEPLPLLKRCEVPVLSYNFENSNSIGFSDDGEEFYREHSDSTKALTLSDFINHINALRSEGDLVPTKAEEESISTVTEWPDICNKCGSPAYKGLFEVVCSKCGRF